MTAEVVPVIPASAVLARSATLAADGLIDNLDQLCQVAGTVKKLRELVLDLAVRGALVPQSPVEGTADALVDRIRLARRSAGGNKAADGSDVWEEPADRPFPIPTEWRWVRLGDLGELLGGGTPSKANPSYWRGPIPWVSPKDMKRPYIDDAQDHISKAAVTGSAAKMIPAASLLIVVRGMILAHSVPVALSTREVTINQDMKALVLAAPEIAPFMLRACQAARSRILPRVERSSHGTCRLDIDVLRDLPIPLPPLAEQRRIVTKVDQLMALCDELEARDAKKHAVGARLRVSALKALVTADSTEAAVGAWKRTVENFDVLIDRADVVADLRGTILDLAIRGRFERHEPGEGAAISQLRATKGAAIDEIPLEQQPFRLPDHWAWVRLSDLVASITDGDHQPPPKAREGVAFLTIGNVSAGQLDFSETRFVPRSYYDGLAAHRVPRRGDILYTVVGATYGRPIPVDVDREFCVQRHIAILRPDGSCNPRFLLLFLRSPFAYGQATASITGTAQPTLPLRPLRRFKVPLPPLKAQSHIADMVEMLLQRSTELEKVLTDRDAHATALAKALVASVISPRPARDSIQSP